MANLRYKPAPSSEGQWVAIGLPIGIGMGVALGAALGVAMGNIAVGISMGVAIGAGLGVALGAAFQQSGKTGPVEAGDEGRPKETSR